MRPQRRQPTRLPHPWDSTDKNTGVGCHFLLQCMKVKSESEVTRSCLTFSDPMDCSLLGSSVHGIFQARVLEWGAIAFSLFTSKVLQFSGLYNSLQSITGFILHSWLQTNTEEICRQITALVLWFYMWCYHTGKTVIVTGSNLSIILALQSLLHTAS